MTETALRSVSYSATTMLRRNVLLGLRNKFVLLRFNLCPLLFRQVLIAHVVSASGSSRQSKRAILGLALCSIEAQPRILDASPGGCCELDLRVQCGAPASQIPCLNSRILSQTCLANFLFGNCELLESRGEGIFGRVCMIKAVESMGGGEGGAGHGMIEGLGLRLRLWRRCHRCRSFGRRTCLAEEIDLLGNSAA